MRPTLGLMKPLAVFAVCLGIAISGGVAAAHDHVPPSAVLIVDQGRQEGINWRTSWLSASGKECVGGEGDGPAEFPPALHYERDEVVRIRFEKRHRPDQVRVSEYKAEPVSIPGTSHTVAISHDVEYRLRAHRRGNRIVAWDAVLEPLRVADSYIEVVVTWNDREGCGDAQRMWWNFHVATP